MQNCLCVNRADLLHNARLVQEQVKTPIIAVVKCNGYGVSLALAAEAWYASGVRFFGVSEPQEALALRTLYDDIQILLMSPVAEPQTILALAENNIIFTVTSADSAQTLLQCAGENVVCAHVKIDTGMGRFGIRHDDLAALDALYAVQGINYSGIFSHFALSFEAAYGQTKTQLARFQAALDYLDGKGIAAGLRHIANSAAAIRFPETRLDAVRIGSALVGRLAAQTTLPLKKVGTFHAQVVGIIELKKGDTSGYGQVYTAPRGIRAAVVAIGTCHGFGLVRVNDTSRVIDILRNLYHDLRAYKKPMTLQYQGRRIPVLGRVGNQYTLVDTAGTDIQIGSTLEAPVNILMVDSAVERAAE